VAAHPRHSPAMTILTSITFIEIFLNLKLQSRQSLPNQDQLPSSPKMASSSSSFLGIVSSPPSSPTPEDQEMTPLSTPSKVAFSSSQNPLRSTTPGYCETDIQLLTIEAGRPLIQRTDSEELERNPSESHFNAIERKREFYRKIAVSYSALTLYAIPI